MRKPSDLSLTAGQNGGGSSSRSEGLPLVANGDGYSARRYRPYYCNMPQEAHK